MSEKIDLFLSYNRQDQRAVLAIRQFLELRGICTFLDRDQLVAGLPWPQALEQALLSARAVAVFLGPHDFGLWQKREMFFALDLQVQAEREKRQFPVIPILLKGAQPQPGFPFLNTWADFRNAADESGALEALIRAIERDERSPERSPERRVSDVCPYLGLRAFKEEDQPFYFGREAFIALLVEKISHQRIVAIVGPSGSGKSSVVLAGLLPRIRRQRPPLPTWDAIDFTPGENPWWALAHALMPLLQPDLSEAEVIEQAGILTRALLERNNAMAGTFKRVLERSHGTDRLLVVVDQFEEMFTLAPTIGDLRDERAQKEAEDRKQRRDWFLEDLLASTKSSPVTIVFTLRGDYYSHAVNASPELRDAWNTGQVTVGPMRPGELGQAVTGPANRVGLNFEPGLVNRILKDVGREPGNLPLLEYALTQLWEKRSSATLTSEAYDAFKGVTGAVGDKADRVYKTLSQEEKDACRLLFGRLVHVSPVDTEGADTRQRATRQTIGEAAWQIALKLAASDVRLLVIASDPRTGLETAEVAHEALIRSWETLQYWIREDRSFLLWRQQLEVFRSIWVTAAERGGEALLRGPALDEALKWRKSKDNDLNAGEREFIAASKRARDELDRLRLLARRIAAAIIVLALMAGVGWLGWFGYTRTDRYLIGRLLPDHAAWRSVSESSQEGSSQTVASYLRAVAYIRSNEALRAAEGIQDPGVRYIALGVIAKTQATAGQLAEAAKTWEAALRSAERIRDPDDRSFALGVIAEIQATDGQFSEALRSAERIQDPRSRSNVLSSIAQAQATAGQFSEALRSAEGIQDPGFRSIALGVIARAQATAGQFSEALRSAERIQDPDDRSKTLSVIAKAQATAGRFLEALRSARQIEKADAQVQAYTIILTEYAKARNPQIEQKLKEDKTGTEALMKKK